MHQIQLSDQIFQSLRLRATASGFGSVNDYVVDMIQSDLLDTPNLEHLFTPERLAKIDESIAQIKAGQGMTSEQVDEYLLKVRQEWLEKNK